MKSLVHGLRGTVLTVSISAKVGIIIVCNSGTQAR